MTQILKQSTAVDVLIGPFVDSTDGYTAEAGVSPAVKLSKNGQALAAKNDVTTPVHDADGYYNCELDATDTNTVGTLVLSVVGSATSLPVRHEYQVIEEAIYDALFAASAAAFDSNQRVDVGSWLGTAVTTSSTSAKPEVDMYSISDDATAANNAESDYDGTGYSKSNSTIGTCTTNTDMRGTDSAALASVCTEARLAELDAANLPADIAGLNDLSAAEVNAEVVDALNVDTYAEPGQGAPPATASIVSKIGYMFKAFRNKVTVDATNGIRIYADDTTTVDQEGAVSDDGTTFERSELGTGA